MKCPFISLQGIFNIKLNLFLLISNVIEKCLAYGHPMQKNEIISEIILRDDETNDSLLAMVKDKFGNYVVQKMIEVADNNVKEIIIKRIISSQSLKKRDGFCNLKCINIFYSETRDQLHRENGIFC